LNAVELVALAGSMSLLAGWRLYLCVFAAGLAMRFAWLPVPEHLDWLAVLQNPWVIGAAFIGLVMEFLADKVAWVDSAWDTIHTAVRPVGGALLSLAIVDPQDPALQITAFLLGGGLAFAGHSAKAGTRAAVNLSPEPFSNVAVSSGEDVATAGLLAAAIASPELAIIVFLLLLIGTLILLVTVRRLLRRLRGAFAPRPVANASIAQGRVESPDLDDARGKP